MQVNSINTIRFGHTRSSFEGNVKMISDFLKNKHNLTVSNNPEDQGTDVILSERGLGINPEAGPTALVIALQKPGENFETFVQAVMKQFNWTDATPVGKKVEINSQVFGPIIIESWQA